MRNVFFTLKQNIVLIIKRIYKRRISNFANFVNMITNLFSNHTINIFTPTTSFNDTLNYFGRAKYIFAPHGAGLSNIILCHRNTTIFEFLIYKRPNLCYASLSLSLGYIYFGIYQHFDGYNFHLNISYLQVYLLNYISK